MATTRLVPELLKRNEEYAKGHTALPLLPELTKPPKTIIYCCLDARVRPEDFLDITPGEAILVRNAGGNVPANLSDLLLLDQLLNLEEILVIEHTDCGGTYITDEQAKQNIAKMTPDHPDEIAALKFGTFKDIEGRARDFVKFIKSHPLIRKELAATTTGVVYDIKTGKVTPVDA